MLLASSFRMNRDGGAFTAAAGQASAAASCPRAHLASRVRRALAPTPIPYAIISSVVHLVMPGALFGR